LTAFDFETEAFRGVLESQRGEPLQNPGLWALAFGNGGPGFSPHTLYFVAGIDRYQHRLFGSNLAA
jgi:hypothetical protein